MTYLRSFSVDERARPAFGVQLSASSDNRLSAFAMFSECEVATERMRSRAMRMPR